MMTIERQLEIAQAEAEVGRQWYEKCMEARREAERPRRQLADKSHPVALPEMPTANWHGSFVGCMQVKI